MPPEMSDEAFEAGLGIPQDSPTEDTSASMDEASGQETQESQAAPWLRDIDEETGYSILQNARNLPDKLSAYRDQVYGKLGGLERQVKELSALAGKINSQAAIDPAPIRKILEKYDSTLAESGLAEALAEAIKVTPLDEDTISPFLQPVREQLGTMPIGAQIVLSHYTAEDLNAIVPPADDQGNLVPQSQRHKDFLAWYELQPHATQVALEQFGPQYVHALRQFEKWEAGRRKEKVQSAGANVQRLAGGRQPSGLRKNGASAGPQTAEEAFLQAWNEED